MGFLLPRARAFGLLALPVSLTAAAVVSGAGCSDILFPTPPSDGGTPVAEAGPEAGGEGGTGLDGGDDGSLDAFDSAPPYDCAAEDAGFGPPQDLACTGLYADFQTKTISPAVQPFDPGLHLWSDGATKRRFIYFPPGTKVDTSDMNEWTFPVGTKVWKEFSLEGHIVETRLFWKRGDNDWVRGAYVWSDDGTSAVFTPGGVPGVGGGTYEVPSQAECDECHGGRQDRLLGFEAVSLSQASSSGLNMPALIKAGLLTSPPTGTLTIPDDGTGKGAPALAWLHANCGTACHNPSASAFAKTTTLWMRLEVSGGPDAGVPHSLGAYASTNTYRTAVNVPANLQPYGALGWKRITPNDPFTSDGGLAGLSLIPLRDGTRNDPQLQMPPIDSHQVDVADLAMVKDWIKNGNFP